MTTSNDRKTNVANIALWVLQGLLAAAFLMGGITKFSNDEMMIENFDKIGLGQWFRYFTGAIEVIAAILLIAPRFSAFGAALLVCTMVGATIAHFTVLGGSAIPAIVLGILSAIVCFGRRQSLAWLSDQASPTNPPQVTSQT